MLAEPFLHTSSFPLNVAAVASNLEVVSEKVNIDQTWTRAYRIIDDPQRPIISRIIAMLKEFLNILSRRLVCKFAQRESHEGVELRSHR